MVSGFALGGIAKGLESAEEARNKRKELALREQTIAQDSALRSRALDIQDAQEKRLANQDLLSQADKHIGDLLKVVGETIKQGKAAGHTPEQLSLAVSDVMAEVDRLASAVGRDGGIYRKQVDAMLAAPTATETAAAEGQAEGVAQAAKTKAMSEAGVSSSSVLETIKLKIARGEQLTPGEERLYQDSVKSAAAGASSFLQQFLSENNPTPTVQAPAATPVKTTTVPAPAPAIPTNLVGKQPKWSPSKQKWYLADGSAYNQQGVPVSP
jgi:hypothetical protein